jgi:hypothetical protein
MVKPSWVKIHFKMTNRRVKKTRFCKIFKRARPKILPFSIISRAKKNQPQKSVRIFSKRTPTNQPTNIKKDAGVIQQQQYVFQ